MDAPSACNGAGGSATGAGPFTLHVEAEYAGVTSMPAGISCTAPGSSCSSNCEAGPSCSASYAAGTLVTLHAEGLDGFVPKTWTGACGGLPPSDVIVEMDADVTCGIIGGQ